MGSRKDEANQFHRLKVFHLHLFHLYMCEAEDVTMESAEAMLYSKVHIVCQKMCPCFR